jgi:hypothetical protein
MGCEDIDEVKLIVIGSNSALLVITGQFLCFMKVGNVFNK